MIGTYLPFFSRSSLNQSFGHVCLMGYTSITSVQINVKWVKLALFQRSYSCLFSHPFQKKKRKRKDKFCKVFNKMNFHFFEYVGGGLSHILRSQFLLVNAERESIIPRTNSSSASVTEIPLSLVNSPVNSEQINGAYFHKFAYNQNKKIKFIKKFIHHWRWLKI